MEHVRDALPHGPVAFFPFLSLVDPLISLLLSQVVLASLEVLVHRGVVFELLLVLVEICSDVLRYLRHRAQLLLDLVRQLVDLVELEADLVDLHLDAESGAAISAHLN